MTRNDKEIRSEYIFLLVQSGLDFLKSRPTLADVAAESEKLKAGIAATGGTTFTGNTDLFKKPGSVMGRCSTTVHNIIHNMTLGDFNDRNDFTGRSSAAAGTGQRGERDRDSGPAASCAD